MVNINLLPWRAQLEKERQKEFIALLLMGIIASFFICIVFHIIISKQLSKQFAVNAYLSTQISMVDQQIDEINAIKQQKSDLLRRLAIIHALQTSRILLVEMFNNFVNVLPNGIYVTSIKKNNSLITVTGKARSNQQVSELMKNIDASSSFINPLLTEIQDNTNNSSQPVSTVDELYPQGFELQMTEESTEKLTPAQDTPTTPNANQAPQTTPIHAPGSMP